MTFEHYPSPQFATQSMDTHVDHKFSSSADDYECIDANEILHLLQSDDDLPIEEGTGLSEKQKEKNNAIGYAMDSPFDYDTLFDDDDDSLSEKSNSAEDVKSPMNSVNLSSNQIKHNEPHQFGQIEQIENSQNGSFEWSRKVYSNVNQFTAQQKPQIPNGTQIINSSIDPSLSFEQHFAKTKDNLFKSMQQSEMSRAHIEQVIDKRIIRRHSSNSMELATSRKRLQEMFVDNPSNPQGIRKNFGDHDTNKRPSSGSSISQRSAYSEAQINKMRPFDSLNNVATIRNYRRRPSFNLPTPGSTMEVQKSEYRRSSWHAGNKLIAFPSPETLLEEEELHIPDEVNIPNSIQNNIEDLNFDNIHHYNDTHPGNIGRPRHL